MNEKEIYSVSFKYSDTTYCKNIAIGTLNDVGTYYNRKYSQVIINGATQADLDEAKKKGMPVVEVGKQETDKERADKLEKIASEATNKYIELLEKYTALEQKYNETQALLDFYDAMMTGEETEQ